MIIMIMGHCVYMVSSGNEAAESAANETVEGRVRTVQTNKGDHGTRNAAAQVSGTRCLITLFASATVWLSVYHSSVFLFSGLLKNYIFFATEQGMIDCVLMVLIGMQMQEFSFFFSCICSVQNNITLLMITSN